MTSSLGGWQTSRRVLTVLITLTLWSAVATLLIVAMLPWSAGLAGSQAMQAWLTVIENLRPLTGFAALALGVFSLLLRRGRVAALACSRWR